MNESSWTLLVTALLLLIILVPYAAMVRRSSKKQELKRNQAIALGADKPVAQHPRIDQSLCIGCSSCVIACPEGALGLIDGMAELVLPAKCVGHGICAEACPVSGIKIVLDPTKSTAEIPILDETYESNIPNIYLIGELGGMALLRNAIFQGKHVIDSIAEKIKYQSRKSESQLYDVAIIGAGAAGLSAGLRAIEHELKYVLIEKEETPGGAILSYPRQKLVMTVPVEIPKYGWMRKKELSKEELLELWNLIIKKTGLVIHCNKKLENIVRENGHLLLQTQTGDEYRANNVVLALGRRGTPRKLNIPGENSSKVTYQLLEAGKYENSSVMVIGAGDAGVEAAIGLSKQKGMTVTLINIGDSFSRIKPKNQDRINEAEEKGVIKIFYNSKATEIKDKSVILATPQGGKEIINDFVFVFAGGEMPTPFLKKIGIEFMQKERAL